MDSLGGHSAVTQGLTAIHGLFATRKKEVVGR
jgi:hypothetical protein